MNATERVHRKVLTKHPRLGTSSSLRKALTAAAAAPRLMPKPHSAPTRPTKKQSKEAAKNVFSYTTIYGEKRSKPFRNINGTDMFNMSRKNQERYMLKKGL